MQLGAQSYSFRDRPLDAAIEGMKAVGLGSIDSGQATSSRGWSGRSSTTPAARRPREDARKFRMETPLSHFHGIGDKFKAAGIDVYAYNISFRDDFTDEEISKGFDQAKAVGAKVITASSNQNTTPRIDAVPRSRRCASASTTTRAWIRTSGPPPPTSRRRWPASSEYICVNLDIGHFTAANQDAVAFLNKHHGRIVTLHIKDRKKDDGPNMPFGQGDTPIKEVLALLAKNQWPIPANIEYEYKGEDTVAEVRRCVDYCKSALA